MDETWAHFIGGSSNNNERKKKQTAINITNRYGQFTSTTPMQLNSSALTVADFRRQLSCVGVLGVNWPLTRRNNSHNATDAAYSFGIINT